jgi:hypothetical protein
VSRARVNAGYVPTPALEHVVKERARQLRASGTGYIAAVAAIVDELHKGMLGKPTPITAMRPVAGLTAPQVISILRLAASIIGSVVSWLDTKRERRKAERRKLTQMVSP